MASLGGPPQLAHRIEALLCGLFYLWKVKETGLKGSLSRSRGLVAEQRGATDRGKNLAHSVLRCRDGMRLAFDWCVDRLFTFSFLQMHPMG